MAEKTEEKTELNKTEETDRPKRQIVIETDGNEIKLIKAEVSGKIELVAIFQNLIVFLNQQK